jgi:arylsulfatase A-like enzyme
MNSPSLFRRLPVLASAVWLASSSVIQAQVTVDFSHSYVAGGSATQNTGDITLAFTVDASGNVTLDASCTDPDPATYVNDFDGAVGTVSDPAMWGQSFSIALSETGSGTLRIDNTGSGLAAGGGNAQIIDANSSGINEIITATVAASGSDFLLQGVNYAGLTNGGIALNSTPYTPSGSSGTIDVSAQSVDETFSIASSVSTVTQGFKLSGLTFDLVPATPTATDVVVSFANTGTGFGPMPPFVTPGSASATITLDFSIDGAGVIALDASTSSTNTVFQATVDEWDNASAGSVGDAALLGQSFTLVGSPSGGNGNLTITENDGGGIGISGENGNRVDGKDYGDGNVNSTPETLTWTLTAPVGVALNLTDWSHAEGNNGDIEVSNGSIDNDFPNLSSSAGTNALSGITLVDGDSLTFREIDDIGLTGGAAIAGFSFTLTADSSEPGFDNGSGDGLWTNPLNWNPNGVPAAPDDAIINGYEVILNSVVASSPAALEILDGSLTINGSGSLSIDSMSIGAVLESEVNLVMQGSSASLAHSGSGVFTIGSAATVLTLPDNSGSSPLELDSGTLDLEIGYEWILDGSNYSGSFTVGEQFILVNFGTLTGPGFGSGNEDGFSDTAGFRTRNFDLPADRKLQLVATATSIYYEVVAQTAAIGPNIIIINVDDMAAGQHFGFDSDRAVNTPTLDALANTGINFTEGFAASTVCGPARYSLMTGRWPSRNTSDQFIARFPLDTLGRFAVADTEFESDNQNLGAWLQQAGYRTGMVGKGHFTDDDLNSTNNWAAKGLLTYEKTADPATDITTNARIKHNHRVLCQRMRAFGFDYVSSYYKANLAELKNNALNVHNQEWITKGALDFIEENKAERFFLYMAPTINHGPVRNDLSKTLGADNRYTSAGYLPNEDYSFMPSRQAIISEVNAAGNEQFSARETWLDYSIAAIVNKLDAHGIRNDTLIIFTSDHGEKDLNSTRQGQGPVIWGKSSLFDLGIRVPLVMNWPNGINSAGRDYDEMVSHVDLAPTLLALAGASSLPTRPVDGVSLVPVINSASAAAVRSDLFAEIGYARAVRTKDRKYVAVRYTPTIYSQIDSGYLWERVEGNTATGELTEPRPYYVNNRQLGSLAANSHPENTYFADDQLYNLTADPTEGANIYGQEPATAYDLKKRLANYIGGIPNRPFRQSSDGSTEFSLAPTSAPSAPAALQMQFTGLNAVQLDWSDAANSELGYVVRKTVNGGAPQIIAELPSGSTSTTAALDPGVEDIVIEVSSYNAVGDSPANVDLLAPDHWRFRTFGDTDPELDDPSSQWDFDADGDGLVTLWEYAFGTDPLLASSVAAPIVSINDTGAPAYLELLVPRDSRRTVQISGSVSSDLSDPGSWDSGESHVTIQENTATHLLFRSATPVGNGQQFIRAEIVEPTP